MIQKLLNLAILTLAAISIFSCSKQPPITLNDSLDLAMEEIFADDLYEDVFSESFDILFDPSDYFTLKSDDEDEWPQCRTKTVDRPEDSKWDKIVTIHFGDGCEDRLGHVRSGKMIIKVKGKYRDPGSRRVITFKKYFVNGNQVLGKRTIENAGRNENGHLVFGVSVPEGKIIRKDGVEINRKVEKTREWVKGEDTRARKDDVFVINGTVFKVKGDVEISKTITDLHRMRSCRFPVSGTVEVTTSDDRPDAIIDYGDRNCDKWAAVTIDGETWKVNLKKRGKKWEKQDDDGVEKED
jgi:hypothetical protein